MVSVNARHPDVSVVSTLGFLHFAEASDYRSAFARIAIAIPVRWQSIELVLFCIIITNG